VYIATVMAMISHRKHEVRVEVIVSGYNKRVLSWGEVMQRIVPGLPLLLTHG
jgi:hypothetical protein